MSSRGVCQFHLQVELFTHLVLTDPGSEWRSEFNVRKGKGERGTRKLSTWAQMAILKGKPCHFRPFWPKCSIFGFPDLRYPMRRSQMLVTHFDTYHNGIKPTSKPNLPVPHSRRSKNGGTDGADCNVGCHVTFYRGEVG